jgi:quinol monooxygenase YgiN
MSRLVLVVNVTVKPGHTERLRPAMLENAANSAKEPGCRQFDVSVSQDDQNSFIFYEVYDDEAALAEHRQTPHFLKYWNLMQELGDNVERRAQQYTLVS